MNLSILQNFDGDLKKTPFPYITIDNALPDSLYNELEATYPSIEKIAGESFENNSRYQISAKEGLVDPDLSDVWKDFINYHTSKEFYSEVMDIFGRFCPLYKNKETCVRNDGDKIQLDCQVGINTPVTSVSTVKGAHVDNRVEIYAGLFYMKKDEDQSQGGDLNIYKCIDEFKPVHKKEYGDDLFEIVDTVRYSRNKFVMFLCSPKSFHVVTPRDVTEHERRLVNVIAEVPSGKFW